MSIYVRFEWFWYVNDLGAGHVKVYQSLANDQLKLQCGDLVRPLINSESKIIHVTQFTFIST